jgi:hypothetical protein
MFENSVVLYHFIFVEVFYVPYLYYFMIDSAKLVIRPGLTALLFQSALAVLVFHELSGAYEVY